MDAKKLREHDLNLLKQARALLEKAQYEYGNPQYRQQMARLETIIGKIDELIVYKAEERVWE